MSRRSPVVYIAAIASCLACTCQAQEAPSATTEVTVRGTRFATYRGDAEFSHVDLGHDDIIRAPSVDSALRTQAQASLFRRSSSLTANPTVQGISLRAIGPSGAGRALVTLDGIPQNDPFGNWVIWAAIPQDAIDRVHVLRGAGGGAYGAGALTGVIDLSLASPRDTPLYGRLELGEASNSRADLGFAVGDVALNASTRELHGDVPVREPQRGAADVPVFGRDHAVLMNAEVPLCRGRDCGEIAVLAGGYDSRRNTGLAGATALSQGDQYSVSYARQPHDGRIGYRLQLWHDDSNLSNTSVSVGAGRATATLSNNQFKTPAQGSGFNAALRAQTALYEWEIGADGRDNSGESRELYAYVSGNPTRYRVSGGETSLIGLYAEGTRSIGRWSLTGAARVDRWRSFDGHRSETLIITDVPSLDLHPAAQGDTVASGRLGVGYSLSNAVSLRAAIYTGFRPPSLNELYRPFRVGNDVTDANAALRLEKLDGFEVGINGIWMRVRIDADVFSNVLRDPITNVTLGRGPGTFGNVGFVPVGGSYRQRRNLGEIAATGFEARGRYEVTPDLTLTTSMTLTHAHVRNADANPALNGLRPAEAPDYDVTLGIETHLLGAQLRGDWLFEGEAFDDDLNTQRLKPSRRLSLNAEWPLAKRLALEINLDNALNDRIQISHAADNTIGYDNRRTLSLAVVWRQ